MSCRIPPSARVSSLGLVGTELGDSRGKGLSCVAHPRIQDEYQDCSGFGRLPVDTVLKCLNHRQE